MSNKIIVSVTNDLSTDQRVHKVCTTLLDMGFDVHLVGFLKNNSKKLNRNYSTYRFKMLFSKGPLFYLEYSLKLFTYLIFNKSNYLLSNDLDTLLPNFLIAKIKSKKIIFDAHEIFSESPELLNRPNVKKVWHLLETFLLPKVDYSYTVCNLLAKFYHEKYAVEMSVVRNVPFLTNYSTTTSNQKILIFQGNYNKGRGLELAVEGLEFLPDFKLIIVGGGFDHLKKIAKSKNVLDQIQFVGEVPFEKLKMYTSKASIGLLLEQPIGLSFSYSLPNKLFDYIHSDLKFIASPLLEVKNIVEKYSIGMLLEDRCPQKFAKQIKELYQQKINPTLYTKAKEELNWQNEEKVLKTIFEKVRK
ncbi:MAG: glycosyltransferase [Flavobacteriales bacterium]